jgi:hypothetical protein
MPPPMNFWPQMLSSATSYSPSEASALIFSFSSL